MTAEAEISLVGAVQIHRVGRVVNPVTGKTGHRVPASRVTCALSQRVSDAVFVSVAAGTNLHRTPGEHQWDAPAVGRVAGRAFQFVAVGDVPSGLPGVGAARIVAAKAEWALRLLEQAGVVPGVRVVTIRATPPAARNVGKRSVARRFHPLLMAPTAQFRFRNEQGKGLLRTRGLVTDRALSLLERGVETAAEETLALRRVRVVALSAAGPLHGISPVTPPEPVREGVAGGTDLAARSQEKPLVVRGVGIVAPGAVAGGEGRVLDRTPGPLRDLLMAHTAEFRRGADQ
jgi:hypothetical protein